MVRYRTVTALYKLWLYGVAVKHHYFILTLHNWRVRVFTERRHNMPTKTKAAPKLKPSRVLEDSIGAANELSAVDKALAKINDLIAGIPILASCDSLTEIANRS